MKTFEDHKRNIADKVKEAGIIGVDDRIIFVCYHMLLFELGPHSTDADIVYAIRAIDQRFNHPEPNNMTLPRDPGSVVYSISMSFWTFKKFHDASGILSDVETRREVLATGVYAKIWGDVPIIVVRNLPDAPCKLKEWEFVVEVGVFGDAAAPRAKYRMLYGPATKEFLYVEPVTE